MCLLLILGFVRLRVCLSLPQEILWVSLLLGAVPLLGFCGSVCLCLGAVACVLSVKIMLCIFVLFSRFELYMSTLCVLFVCFFGTV